MRLILFSRDSAAAGTQPNLLRFALSCGSITDMVLDGLSADLRPAFGRAGLLTSLIRPSLNTVAFAVPQEWDVPSLLPSRTVVRYDQDIPVPAGVVRSAEQRGWLAISNGRFAARPNYNLLGRILSRADADILAVSATPALMAHRETVRFTGSGKVAGFSRLYADSAELAPAPVGWPHHLFVRARVLDKILPGYVLPGVFLSLVDMCKSNGFELRSVNMAGSVLDIEAEWGLLTFCAAQMTSASLSSLTPAAMLDADRSQNANDAQISSEAAFSGVVMLGKDVSIAPQAVIIGPTIIADRAQIGRRAAVHFSIIGPDAVVGPNQVVSHRIIPGPQCDVAHDSEFSRPFHRLYGYGRRTYRSWSFWSYPRCIKRIADIITALIVLVLLAPFTPFIALAIRLNSPGPVFFKDKRQGLRGKIFDCVKFRTMKVGAQDIQDRLRTISEVDGPQFKIADDPRMSTVGRFLRETYIDEVPQFFNVLLGQMSTVGPRPSPESENTLCPWWRDARLSVRPGITGLWQVCRTRRPMNDFQEWIFYDTKYVADLSLRLDLWICWRTAKRMIHDFVRQF